MPALRRRDERGFTLVEVLAAMLVLLVGLLGTVKLIDAANATSVKTRARENANNLAREVMESARVIDYDSLTGAAVKGALQAQPQLADSTAGTPAWTIERGNRTFTLTVTACTYDDAKDSVTPTHDGSFCSNTPVVTPATDTNGDDFRRVDVTISWPLAGSTAQVRQTALIINPSGGLGPRIVSFAPVASTTNPSVTIAPSCITINAPNVKITCGNDALWTATSSFASSLHWNADDGASEGDATEATTGTVWNVRWPLGSDPATPPYILDGNYDVSAHAFDAVGIPGDQRVSTLTLNRSAPFAPAGLRGGRNDHFGTPTRGVVDLFWNASSERDIIGYRVYDTKNGIAEDGDDRLVCPLASNAQITATYCTDESPPVGATTYYVKAVDMDNASPAAARTGTRSALLSVPAASAITSRPVFAAGSVLTATLVTGPTPRLTWPAATDPDGTILFYRVYRDTGTALTDRWDFTETNSPFYTEPQPGASTAHRYWVTAVDNSYQESDPLGPVDSP